MKILKYELGEYGTNCYLVYDEQTKKACLIDPADYDLKIEQALSAHGLRLEYIILTHGHFDHLLGASKFKEKTGAKIAAHELEAEYLENPDKSLTSMAGGMRIHADVFLKEGDVLNIGDVSIKVIHTPGHTKGSCCFMCETEPVIFSGDTMFKDGVGRTDLYGGDYNTLLASLRRLKAFGDNYKICPGHGEDTTLGEEPAY